MDLLVGFDRGAMDRNREAEEIWARFAASVRIPFAYEAHRGRAYAKGIDAVACASLVGAGHEDYRGVEYARIVFGQRFSEASPSERFLTLLHESIHLARNIGDLRPINEAKAALIQTVDCDADAGLFAFRLAEQILEADAEFFLRDNYPDRAAERARYYADMQRRAARERPWAALDSTNRPYGMLGYVLRLELATLLLRGSGEETADLDRHLAQLRNELDSLDLAPQIRTALNEISTILSPSRDDFRSVAAWGPAAYRAVVEGVTEAYPK